MSDKKSKVQPKSLKNLLFGIPANVAVGPLGFRAELDVSPKDENNPAPSRIVLCQDRESKGPPAPETLALSTAIGGIEHGGDTVEEDVGNTGQEDSEPTDISKDQEPYHKDSPRMGAATPSDVARKAVDGFDLLRTTIRKLFAVCIDHKETSAVRNKLDVLLWRIDSLDSVFALPPGNVIEMERRHLLIPELEAIGGKLQSLYENLTGPLQVSKDIFKSLEDLQEKIFDYQTAQRTMVNNQGLKQIDPAEATILNNFPSAQQAEYRHCDRSGCLKGTRSAILDEIELWSRDHDKPPVYWLNGLAGTGKTTIAQTVAERTFADGRLGASFFCSRDFEERSNLRFIFPTLAVQLARRYPEFRSTFVPLAQSDPGVAHESLCGQMNKLIVQPLVESGISTVIVIDALDECKDEEPTSTILSILGQFVAKIPEVKFFVTGRPESRIRTGFSLPLLAEATDVFILHEVEPSQVGNDVRLFFNHNFAEIRSRHPGLGNWPTEKQLDQICKRAAGLFVYAMAVIRCINQKNKTPEGQLDRLLQSTGSGMEGKTKLKADTTLDSLYMSILQEAFGDGDPEDDSKVRSVLGAMILATDPLSPSAIAAILGFDPRHVFSLLSSMSSLLVLQEDINHSVQPFHKSFPDFLVDPSRCADKRFCISPSDQHTEILVGCLDLMNRKLEQNMCKLPDYVVNWEVLDLEERVEEYIGDPLQYACTSWHKHLIAIPTDAFDPTHILHHFLEKKFVFWLEVLSILDVADAEDAIDALEVVAERLDTQVSPTLDLINDCAQFVTTFSEVISQSAPHIYHSALPLSPETSIVRQLYGEYACPFASVIWGLPTSWSSFNATTSYREEVRAVTRSPCDRFIAVDWSMTGKIELLDAPTLKSLKVLTPCEPDVCEHTELRFSPDGRLITRFGSEKITSWDFETGGQVHTRPREPHEADKKCFSSASSMDGTLFAVALGNSYHTFPSAIVTYNLLSSTRTHHYYAFTDRVATPIWIHDERIRFATVTRGSITISEIGFDLARAPVEVESLPAPDNVAYAKCRRWLFFPTLSRLAFIQKGEIFVWDAQGSKFLLISTERWYGEMSSSPDGRFFAGISGNSSDQEIRVWKESPDGYRLHQKIDVASPGVTTLLLSSSGESVVATKGSAQLPFIVNPTLPSLSIQSSRRIDHILSFSPDGSLVAIVQPRENMVAVVDLKSGGPRLVVDAGMRIDCLGVTGSTLVAVGGRRVVTWNVPTGDCAVDGLANINYGVQSTILDQPRLADATTYVGRGSISPDLKHIAIVERGKKSAELSIYDTSTGKYLVGADTDLRETPRFTQDGRGVWFPGGMWRIVGDSGSGLMLEHSRTPPPPSRSPHGHCVRGEWVLNSANKRILWLPYLWRLNDYYRVWNNWFPGLSHQELPEVVILEFYE